MIYLNALISRVCTTIPILNRNYLLRKFLLQLQRETYAVLTIIEVDNGSSGGNNWMRDARIMLADELFMSTCLFGS